MSEAAPRDRRPRPGTVLAVAAVVLLAFAFLGTRGLWEPDEGRYVAAADAMVSSGDWIVPTLHGQPHLTKPPLTYWLIAAGIELRPDEWGARLYLAPVLLLTAALLAALGARLWGRREGALAGLVYPTMLLPFVASGIVTTDPLLTLWETAALACFWEGWTSPDDRRRRAWSAGLWLALALGFLTKGPPALLPLLIVAAFLLARPRHDPDRARPGWVITPLGLGLFTLVALPWFVAVARLHPGLLEYFVIDEIVRRATSAAFGRNSEWWQIFKVYLPPLLFGTLPWILVWPWLLRRRVATTNAAHEADAPGDRGRRVAAALRPSALREDPRRRLLAAWIVVPLVLFSALSSRQILYILPVFPALALATTGGLLALPRRGRMSWPAVVALGLWVAALVGLRYAGAQLDVHRNTRPVAEFVESFVAGDAAEVVIIDRQYHALGFYLDVPVREAKSRPPDEPSYVPATTVEQHLAKFASRGRRQVFVADRERAAALAPALEERCATLHVEPGPYDLAVLVCAPDGASREQVGRRDTPGAAGGEPVRTRTTEPLRTPAAAVPPVTGGAR